MLNAAVDVDDVLFCAVELDVLSPPPSVDVELVLNANVEVELGT